MDENIGNIVLFLISMFMIFATLILFYRAIKKSNSFAEKIAQIVLAIVMATILIIYYLDRYNILTILNLGMNINTQNWLLLIGNYITGVISAVIGALVAVWTTIYQIRKNNEENNRRNEENLKIQNMPILKYEINTERRGTGDLSELIVTNKENELGLVCHLNIILKNIGMNSIRNIIIDFTSSVINDSIYRLLGKGYVNPIEKGETIELNKYFSLKLSDQYYKMNLIIYYQDVLFNWYKQEIQIHYSTMSKPDNAYYSGLVTYKIQKEEEIDEGEIESNSI